MNKTNCIMMTLIIVAAISALTGCKTAEPATARSPVTTYTCPMHPEIVRPAPGNCPICGMALMEKR